MKKNIKSRQKNRITAINIFFKHLNEAGVDYVLISNYYYELQSGGDIDLYVPPHDKEKFLKIIGEIGFKHRKKPPVLPNHNFYIFFDGLDSLLLDVKYELSFYTRDGYRWLYDLEEKVIPDRHIIKNSYRPGGFDALILYAAHCSILERLRIEQSHIRNLKKYLKDFRGEVDDPQQKKIINDIETCLRTQSNPELLPGELSSTIGPFFLIKRKSNRWRNLKLRFLFGLGFTVLFLGADGTGKTTLVKALQKEIPLKNKILYLGMGKKGWLLKSVQKYQNFCQEILWAGRFRFGLLFSWVLLPLELSMRRLKTSIGGKYAVIFIDRFPGWPFVNGGPIKWLYRYILPRPDLIVLLGGDPETIFSRKPDETTPERVEKELKKWAIVANRIDASKIFKIDTTHKDIQGCLEEILMTISNNPVFKQKMLKPCRRKNKIFIRSKSTYDNLK